MIKHLKPKSKEELTKVYRREQWEYYLKNLDGLKVGLYTGLLIVFTIIAIIDNEPPTGWMVAIVYLAGALVHELWPSNLIKRK